MRAAATAALLVVLSSVGFPACERAAIARGFVADETLAVVQVRPILPSVDRWRDEALRAGWKASQWRRLRCVIRLESGGNPRAVGDGGTSLGLLQIHWPAHRLLLRGLTRSALFNPTTNLRIGRRIYEQQGWRAWRATVRRCP